MALTFKNFGIEVNPDSNWGTCTVTKKDGEGNVEYVCNFRMQVAGSTNIDYVETFMTEQITIILEGDE